MTKTRHVDDTKEPDPANEEELLDEALDETFPASDPIAVSVEPEDNEARKAKK